LAICNQAEGLLVCLKQTGLQQGKRLIELRALGNGIFSLKKRFNYKKGKENFVYKTFLQFISYH